ncbi:MAG: zinc-binding dehydrogenase [Acetobacteraceae bacterium]|nr:zinc-binding dehydrogenase [Acetobacteraceae bacterium]
MQPVAEAAAVHLAWTLTDRDPAAVQAAARRLGARPGWRFAAFDPATATADALAGPFDLVVGTGLAALSEVGPEALSALAARLAEGGAALFSVPAPSRLVDFVFGRDPAWWTGPAERLAGGAAYWHQVLPRAGLAEVSVLAGMDGPAPGGVLLAFGRRLEPREPAAQARPVLLLADPETPAAALASRLAADLARAGRRVALSAPGADWTVEAGSEVVLLPETGDVGDPAAMATARTALALQAARRAQAAQARLWLVTRGAVQPQESEGHNPAEAALWGFGRVVRNEVPALEVRLVDLAPRLGPSAQARAMAQELATPDDEMEVVRTDQGRRVLRLVREETAANPDADGDNRVLAVARPGVLETLTWTSRARRRPGRGEVEIAVAAAGLNFRDVMWAQGLLPEDLIADGFAGPTLGMECAGTVTAVGADVAGLKPGDRVMAFAPSAFASHAVTLAAACLHLSPGLSFAEAATMPVAFLTALYALDECARLAAGETVLIHGGAGGVGLAALQIAKARGARVIATAGSEEKRALLRLSGADAVFDSRGLGFVDGVRAATGGEGVDVVLNSLAGEALEASLALLRPFGRFVELGKRDFALGTRMALRPLARNAAFFGVDLDSAMRADPARAARLFAELGRLASRGAIRPLPYRFFPSREVRDAFRLMQGSGHIGKIVLGPPSPAPRRRGASAPVIREDRTYIVTGGLSGVGLEVARWLAACGARHLALVSRRGATAEAEPVLADLARRGRLGLSPCLRRRRPGGPGSGARFGAPASGTDRRRDPRRRRAL